MSRPDTTLAWAAAAALEHLPTHGGGMHPAGPTTIDTYSGRRIDLAHPTPAAICVQDIAHALSNACRFIGHPTVFYSVAEHSCLVHDLVLAAGHGARWAAAALYHDAHEAYLGDVATPLKPLIGPAYAALAAKMDRDAVAPALGLDPREFTDPIVKGADAWAFLIEARRLRPHEGGGWARFADVPDLPDTITWATGLLPEPAEQAFLDRAASLADLGACAA